MKSKNKMLRLVALLFAFSLVAPACGNDDAEDSSDTTVAAGTDEAAAECTTLNPAGDLATADLTGVELAVGSKDFTEQIVLGEILVQALEAKGATVTNNVNIGGTSVNREALLAGELDSYWEYNGTGWTVHLGNEDPSFDSVELTTVTCAQDLADNNIRWVGKSPFNDTYGFASGPDLDVGDLQGMADYLAENEDATVCMETEFPSRPDGLVLFEEATGYVVPETQTEILDTGVIYDETANGNCTFGEVFTTDGRIGALGLNLAADPGVFILYNVSLTIRDETYQQAPEAFDAIVAAILAPLDEAKMAELNARRDVGGEDASDIATSYLAEIGIS